MSHIRSGKPPTGPSELLRHADNPTAEPIKISGDEHQDTFVPSPPPSGTGPQMKIQPPMESRIQAAIVGKTQAARLQFSNEDIAFLASTFAAILNQHPNADRLKRATLFSKAILKQKKFGRSFGAISEDKLEEMCEFIGELIEGSPVFGKLVDDVTEGASYKTGTSNQQ